jgi:hypothetical protein
MPAAPLPSHPSPAPQATLVWAVRLLVAESVALVGLVIFLAYEGLSSGADNVRVALGVTVFAAFLAALFGGLARALSHRRGWARGPAIVLELLLLPIGYSIFGGGLWWLGLVVMVVGLSGAVTLLAPATRAALGLR